jgi:hypothetical protein
VLSRFHLAAALAVKDQHLGQLTYRGDCASDLHGFAAEEADGGGGVIVVRHARAIQAELSLCNPRESLGCLLGAILQKRRKLK